MENNIGKIIGKNISALRKQRGLTQEGLAGELGLSFQAVSKWETGQSCPDIALLPVIAEFFDIPIDELFARSIAREARPCPGEELPWDDDAKIRMAVFLGKKLLDDEEAAKEYTFILEGEAKDIICHGSISGGVTAKGNVTCKNVGGNVEAHGMVCCGAVGGSLDSGGMVNCGAVGGDLETNGMVSCGDIGGNASAKGDINCGNVGGDVAAEKGSVKCANVAGRITCESIKGNFTACGDIKCATIDGDVTLSGGTLNC